MKSYNPKTLEELQLSLSELDEKGKILAGGTDEIIQMHTFHKIPSELLYVGSVPELCRIAEDEDTLYIGAACTHAEVASNQLVLKYATALADASADVGSPQIRNHGTVGGNIGNASPAGDCLPVMWLLDPEVLIMGPGGVRTTTMRELILGPGKKSLAYNEALIGFRIAKRTTQTHFHKLGFRKRVTISRIGLAVELERENGIVKNAKIIVGAISLTPVECKDAEKAVIGTRLDEEAVMKAAAAVSALIMKITPEKFDRDYKVHSAKGVVFDTFALF